MKSVLVVGAPFRFYGGGHRRNFFLLQEYIKLGLSVSLYIPVGDLLEILYNDISPNVESESKMIRELQILEQSGVDIRLDFYKWIRIFAQERKKLVGIETHGVRSLFKKFSKRSIERKMIEAMTKSDRTPEIVLSYGGHFAQQVSFKFAKKYKRPFILLLGIEPFKAKKYRKKIKYNQEEPLIKRLLFDGFISWYRNHFFPLNFKAYVKSGLLASVISVSKGPIIESQLNEILKSETSSIKLSYLPAYAIELPKLIPEIPANNIKKHQIIYFARLSSDKGIFEIVDIVVRVQKEIPARLYIAGNFYSLRVKEAFFQKAQEQNLDFEYLGHLSGKALYDKIGESWVFANPSHTDAFSTAISEATLLRTCCVAYGIPGTLSVFSGLPSVKLVKENDLDSFANELIALLKVHDEKYEDLFNTENYRTFKESISSWRKVAFNQIKQVSSDLEDYMTKLRN